MRPPCQSPPFPRTILTINRLTCFLACLCLTASAAEYYVDSSDGDDLESGTAPSAAWRSLEKVNAKASQAHRAWMLTLMTPQFGHAPLADGAVSAPRRHSLKETPVFPLKASADRRYLVDQNDQPFAVVGDTPWSLIAQLSEEDIARYLDDRAQRGFNALIVNLIEHKFATHAPANRNRIPPFLKPGDFTQPNPAYFEFAHWAVAAAKERGLTVWLCPAYLGWGGGDEGFFQEIKAAGPSALRAYGRFVGERFKDMPNIVWMVGGDYALPQTERWAGAELALGLRDGGALQLITAHGGQTSAVETFGDEPWLGIETVYRYQPDLWRPLLAAYERRPVRPFVLIESTYEGEHQARPDQIRRQAWWAMLCGACGQFFGNNPIWHFDGPGLFKTDVTWPQALDSTGSRDMARLGRFFTGIAWHLLRPDLQRPLVTANRGEGTRFIAAAATPEGALAVVYIPADGQRPREFTMDLRRFPKPVSAQWFNPAQDTAAIPPSASLSNRDNQTLRTPGDNGTGANDWVLMLEASP